MKQNLIRALAALGGLVLLGGVFMIALVWAVLSGGAERLPDRFVLEMDLREGVVDYLGDDPLLVALEGRRLRLRDLVESLEAAAADPRVQGLRVIGGSALGGWALTDELRDAIVAFRESGKPTIHFAETFGEFVPAQGAYHLATAFEEVVLQPSGDLGLSPLSVEAPFLRDALAKLEINPQFRARREYKDAADLFTRTGFSPASKEALTALLETFTDGLVDGMQAGRGLSADSARGLIARGPWSAGEALEAGLVDRLGYLDEAWAGFEARIHAYASTEDSASDSASDLPSVPVRSVRAYRDAGFPDSGGLGAGAATRVALIHGVGEIQMGRGGELFQSGGFRAGLVADAIRSASEDPSIRAILFRVDSPGGSYVASDLVRHELQRARGKGIPVVVSMGNAAASGGYMVALEADRIVAQPSTVTGSIGVLAGKFAVEEFLGRFGVTLDRIDLGDAPSGFTTLGAFTPEDLARLDRSLDRIYEDFVGHVARGRGLSFEDAEAVARGRVWSGRDAMALGLVDALGGYRVAQDEVRSLLDLPADERLALIPFPEERTLFQLLLEEARGGGAIQARGGAIRRGVETIRWWVSVMQAPGLEVRSTPLRFPGS
jgi:protease-4